MDNSANKAVTGDPAEAQTNKFALNTKVHLHLSGERGHVIGVAFYSRTAIDYLVEYVAADGRQTQGWFHEEALLEA